MKKFQDTFYACKRAGRSYPRKNLLKCMVTNNSKFEMDKTTNFENVSFYGDIDHDLNFYGETKLQLLTIYLPKIQKYALKTSIKNDF